MGKDKCIPVIIPAYEPDEDFIDICKKIYEVTHQPIIVVNDGSDTRYDYIFNKINETSYEKSSMN